MVWLESRAFGEGGKCETCSGSSSIIAKLFAVVGLGIMRFYSSFVFVST